MPDLTPYRKLIAALSAPAALLADALADGEVTGAEGRLVGYGIGAAFLVWLFKNNTPIQKAD